MRCAVLLGPALLSALGCRPSADRTRPDTALATEVDLPATEDAVTPKDEASGEVEPDPDPMLASAPTDPVEPGQAEAEVDGTTVSPPPADSPEGGTETGTETAPTAATKPKGPPPLPRPHYTKVDPSCGNDGNVGEKLKGFSLETTKGKTITQGSYRGRVVVVNFWGTWCKPCLKELPEFDHLYRRYRKHGMTLVAIATDEDPVPVDEFVNKRKLAAKVLIGGEAYANAYGSPKFPFTFVVDHTGVIRASYRGYRPECMGKLEADIRAQLEKRSG